MADGYRQCVVLLTFLLLEALRSPEATAVRGRMELYVHDNRWLPSSLFMLCGVFLMAIDSRMCRAFWLFSLLTIFMFSQSILWLWVFWWSVTADLFISLEEAFLAALVYGPALFFSQSVLCSATLVPKDRPVSPMYVSLQLEHGMLYTTPTFFFFFYFVLGVNKKLYKGGRKLWIK